MVAQPVYADPGPSRIGRTAEPASRRSAPKRHRAHRGCPARILPLGPGAVALAGFLSLCCAFRLLGADSRRRGRAHGEGEPEQGCDQAVWPWSESADFPQPRNATQCGKHAFGQRFAQRSRRPRAVGRRARRQAPGCFRTTLPASACDRGAVIGQVPGRVRSGGGRRPGTGEAFDAHPHSGWFLVLRASRPGQAREPKSSGPRIDRDAGPVRRSECFGGAVPV